jgi:chromosome segregation ATPase
MKTLYKIIIAVLAMALCAVIALYPAISYAEDPGAIKDPTAATAEAAASLGQAQNDMKSADEVIKEAQNAYDKASAALDKVEKSSASSNEQFDAAKDNLEEAGKSLDSAMSNLDDAKAATEQALKDAVAALEDVGETIDIIEEIEEQDVADEELDPLASVLGATRAEEEYQMAKRLEDEDLSHEKEELQERTASIDDEATALSGRAGADRGRIPITIGLLIAGIAGVTAEEIYARNKDRKNNNKN